MLTQERAQSILIALGGRENVQSLTHCMTRLRFKLNNIAIVQTEEIKKLPYILTVVESAGQYQIVMGKELLGTYQAIKHLLDPVQNQEQFQVKSSTLNRIFEKIILIITPLIGALMSSALLKGIVSIAVALNLLANDSSTFLILSAIADSILYYLPFLVALTASKQFKLSPYIGLGLVSVLFAPTLLVDKIDQLEPIYFLFANTLFELPVYFTLLGLPIVVANYTGALLPVIVICYFASFVEKFWNRYLFGPLKHVFLPVVIILSLAPFILVLIGPITHVLGLGFLHLITELITWSPFLAGLIMGGSWQFLIASGLNWVLAPIFLLNITNQGFDNLFVLTTTTVFAQSGAVLGVMLKTKDKELRKISLPIMISGLFGITEPAIYAVTLPRKSPFLISCLVGAIGGAIIAMLGVKKYVLYGFGVLTFPSLINPLGENDLRIFIVIVLCAAAFVVTAIATMIVYREKSEESYQKQLIKHMSEVVLAPQTGRVNPLEQAQNPIFSSGVMGNGCLIESQESKLLAPATGEITTLFIQNKSIEITTAAGAQILVQVENPELHQQMNTTLQKGDQIRQGDTMFEGVKETNSIMRFLIVILNSEKYHAIKSIEKDKVKKLRPLINLEAIEVDE
ncbi:MAG: PTS glucose transporter subunit IIA [Culicoidibacterales bacterium]